MTAPSHSERRRCLCPGQALALQDGAGDRWCRPFRAFGARQAIVWHELGRPGAQDLELSAWPPGARRETIGGASIVIDRPHVRLAVRWPTL
jgi:hypothetical protein